MLRSRYSLTRIVPLVLCSAIALGVAIAQDSPKPPDRAALQKQMQDGNYNDAYAGFRRLALDAHDDPAQVGSDLNAAIICLNQLGRTDEIDDFRDEIIKTHRQNWRLLMAVSESLVAPDAQHFGFIIAGKFSRGQHRGGGDAVNSLERDRVRALELMNEAIPLVEADSKKNEVADFWMALARMLLDNRGGDEAWRLQSLTDLKTLPDYDRGWYSAPNSRGASVDGEGNPIFYHVPKSWSASQTDGERWRWALSQVPENNPQRLNDVRFEFAQFLESQFGVQTMAEYGVFFGRLQEDDAPAGDGASGSASDKRQASGNWSLDTLADDETMARLATGIKRFKLPAEFDFIRIFKQIADDPKTGHGDDALQALAHIFENRRQYDQAAEFWRRSIKEYGPGEGNFKQQQLDQIIDNWGRFEPVMSQPAGQGATIDFRFRNGSKVSFEAHQINVEKLLADVKAYLKSNPRKLDWQKVDVNNIGYRLVEQKQKQYVGERVAAWDLELKPRPNHFDRRITVTTPLQKAGAYLLTAKMADGNTSQIIIWVDDTAIVKKPLDKAIYCYVADAASGAPLPKTNVEFFGYRQRNVGVNRFTIDVQNFAESTDADGQIVFAPKPNDNEYQWIITTTGGGRLAYLGFTGVWSGQYAEAQYNQTKVFTITDRPVYRPSQSVHFKFWIAHAQYDQPDKSEFANQTFSVEIKNPKQETVLSKQFTADAYGGIEGQLDLPADATLGVYQLYVVNYGGGNFRVEEYKKPEYEVTCRCPHRAQ